MYMQLSLNNSILLFLALLKGFWKTRKRWKREE